MRSLVLRSDFAARRPVDSEQATQHHNGSDFRWWIQTSTVTLRPGRAVAVA